MIIYKTINNITGMFYVGKDLKNNPNYLGSGLRLKRAISKYGRENFTKEILQVCSSLVELDAAEVYWIATLQATTLGYNIAPGGTGGKTRATPWNKGLTKESDERVKRGALKVAKVLLGHMQSEETKNKRTKRLTGLKRTKEQSNKISASLTGKTIPQTVRDKISAKLKQPEAHVELSCVSCGRIFTRRRSRETYRQKIGKTGPYCSKSCSVSGCHATGVCGNRMTKQERLLKSLNETGFGKMKVFGNSMMPKIKSGSTLTFQKLNKYAIGDIVFSKVNGRWIDAHLITAIDAQGRYLISNNKNHDNGWTNQVFGKAIIIEAPNG